MDGEIKLISPQVSMPRGQLAGALGDSWQDKMLQERCRTQCAVSMRECGMAAAQGVNIKAI